MDNTRFAELMFKIATEVANSGRKVNPIILACQGILESGYGKSLLSSKANNLFGIKAGKSWKGPVYNIKTREFDTERGWYVTLAGFRLYSNWAECFNDYAGIIERLSWYKDAAENCKDPIKFLDGILPTNREPGWATDPRYREKILAIAKKFNWI
jgi:N-acetylmuramoyl-L-alanine amidase